MADRDYKAFIVEGEAREPLIIDNISKVFFSHGNFKIITLPASESDALQLRAMCFILPIHTFSEVELAQM